MLRITLDTNILTSSLIKRGAPRKLFRKVAEKEVTLVLSKKIIGEFEEVMHREKFQKYVKPEEVKEFVEILSRTAEFTDIKSNFNEIKEDPDDNTVLNTAYDGKARYIVTGDRHLLALKKFKGIKIVRTTEMLKIIEKAKG
jgi:putative PIN family toxin of toxin-antitoxin system